MKLLELNSDTVTFYKALPQADLKKDLIPGTVTTSYQEAYTWWERYNSVKKNVRGAARHIKRQPAVIISFSFPVADILGPEEFQRAGVSEHDRKTSWTSAAKQKAQINSPIKTYKVVLDTLGNEVR